MVEWAGYSFSIKKKYDKVKPFGSGGKSDEQGAIKKGKDQKAFHFGN